jgi:secreted PhoX family phosphatase
MMKNTKGISVLASALALFGLFVFPFAPLDSAETTTTHITDTEPYITLANSTNGSVMAIITSGDRVGDNNYEFAKIPDGIGAFIPGPTPNNTDQTLNIFVNHELNNGTYEEGFAKVSNLKLDQDGRIIQADFAINGSELYEQFCSAYLVEGYGFEHPIYFANEEVGDGIVVAIDGVTGETTEMPWLGKLHHENTIHVPYFYETANKTVVLTFEDGDPTKSKVYMYVADSPQDLLKGNGQLYVFSAEDNRYKTWDEIYYSDPNTISGKFIPLIWNHTTQDEVELHEEAIEAGAFQFIRPEDGAMDKREGHTNTLYMADTGSNADEDDVPIPVGHNGQEWDRGRMYKFTFTDPADPTSVNLEVIMDGNDRRAPGYADSLDEAMVNPDNIDTSINTLMIQEDHIEGNRFNATMPYNVSNNAKILMVDLDSIDEGRAEMENVAYVNQIANQTSMHGEWESSGILDVSDFFGEGSWLSSVQAHTLEEGGQLLLLNVESS